MDCQPVDGASDSEANDIADSSDVLHYVTDSDQLVATSSRPISSSSGYKVFVNGSSGELLWCGYVLFVSVQHVESYSLMSSVYLVKFECQLLYSFS